jgi:hypothetical protein
MSPTRIRAGVQDLPNGARLQIPEDLNFDWSGLDPTPPEINLGAESTTAQFPVGTQLRTPEGLWRYIKAGGTVGIGKVVSAEAPLAQDDNGEVNAAAIGATELTFITDTPTYTAGELVGGRVHIEAAATAGVGRGYLIIKNTAVASAAGMVVTLSSMTPVSVAIGASNNEMTLTKSKYRDCIITASPTVTNPVGVIQFAGADGDFGWIQTAGLCSVLQDTVIIAGEPVIPSVNVDGAVGPLLYADSSAVELPHIGISAHVGANTEHALVDLKNLDF